MRRIGRKTENGMMVYKEVVRNSDAERDRAPELWLVVTIHRIGRSQPGRADSRRIEDDELAVAGKRYGVRLAVIALLIVGRVVAVLFRHQRARIEQAPPPLPCAVARLVVAAHDHPRRSGEQQL